jgi:uncharacterized protein YfaS (alpha-2-macroglobulin family)
MPNRAARVIFDSRAFILPRGQEPRVTVATVNVAALSLRLVRVTERNLVNLTRDWRPGETMEHWTAENVAGEMGRVVWEGRAELPAADPNRLTRTALPIPGELRTAGPGMYVLVARPGDGNSDRYGAGAAIAVLATDLGITAWRGPSGIAAQIRGFSDARPRAGARVALLARNNDILAEAATGEDGLVRFGAAAMRGAGPLAPVAVHAFLAEDFASLDLESASFDLSDRGADGRAHPGPLDAFVWLDRGIYRPGETVMSARCCAMPAGSRWTFRPPAHPPPERAGLPGGGAGAAGWLGLPRPVVLSGSAPVGAWTVEVLADPTRPPIGRRASASRPSCRSGWR